VNKPTQPNAQTLRSELQSLQSHVDLARHEQYPQYCDMVDSDERLLKVLAWAWSPRRSRSPPQLEVLRPSGPDDLIRPRSALIRTKNDRVWQILVGRTRQETSVLGRIGVLDILREQLSAARGKPLTLIHLARMAAQEESHQEATRKSLERLNRGEFIGRTFVQSAASRLFLENTDLAFDSPRLYTPEARERRKKSEEREIRKYKATLISSPIRMTQCEFHNIEDLLIRCRKWELELWKNNFSIFPMEGCVLIAGLMDNLRTARKCKLETLVASLGNLRESGISVWFGEYEDRIALVADPTLSQTILRTIVAFNTRAHPPDVSVDLSHHFDLGPDISLFREII
jgi:hypothetical protein